MMDIHTRCVNIIANLWGAPKGVHPVGTATTGSSEAIHLGGLAMKRRWQERRDKEGKDKSKPNIIMGANAQVALEKFGSYCLHLYHSDFADVIKLDTLRSKLGFCPSARSHTIA